MINYILVILALIGIWSTYISYDLSFQIGKYDNFNVHPYTWLKDLFFSIGSSLITSVLLVALYDQILRIKEVRDRNKRALLAASRLYSQFAFYGFMTLYFLIDRREEHITTGFKHLNYSNALGKEYLDMVQGMDLNSLSSYDSSVVWAKYIQRNFISLKNQVDKVLMTSEPYFDIKTLKQINGFFSSKFISMITIIVMQQRDGCCYIEGDRFNEFQLHIEEFLNILLILDKVRDHKPGEIHND